MVRHRFRKPARESAWGFESPSLRHKVSVELRRSVRVAEGATLETSCTGNCTVGSNPTSSVQLYRAPDAVRLQSANPARAERQQR